jgi:hypothetical protein
VFAESFRNELAALGDDDVVADRLGRTRRSVLMRRWRLRRTGG